MYSNYFVLRREIKFLSCDSLKQCSEFIRSKKNELNKDSCLLKYFKWDYELLVCAENYRINCREETPAGLLNEYEFSSGEKYPDIEKFESERLDFYEACYFNTDSILMKIRYLNYLIDNSKEKYKFVKMLSPLLFEICSSTVDEGTFYNYISRLIILSTKFSNMEFVKKGRILLNEKLMSFIENGQPLWINQYYFLYRKLSFIKRKLIINEAEVDNIISELKKTIGYFNDLGKYEQSIYCCDELIEWLKIVNRKQECDEILKDKINIFVKQGDMYICDERYHIAAHYFECAIRICADNGYTDILNKLKSELKKCYECGKNNIEKKEVPINIPEEFQMDLINQNNQFLTGKPDKDFYNYTAFLIGHLINNNQNLYPTYENSKSRAKKRGENPIWSIVSIAKMQNSRKIADANSKDENIELLTYEEYGTHMQIMFTIHFSNVLYGLISEGLSSDMVAYQVCGCKYLENKDKVLISKGIEHLFENDYISSMHILVPTFENIFRNQFSYHNFGTTTIKPKVIQHEQTFNEFIENDMVKENIPDILLKMIKYVMVDDRGFNLRNNIAHGLAEIETFNETMCNIVLFLILAITRFDWIEYTNNQKK